MWIKKALRPAWRRFWPRLEWRIRAVARDSLEADLASIRNSIAKLEDQTGPSRQIIIDSVPAISVAVHQLGERLDILSEKVREDTECHLDQRIAEIWQSQRHAENRIEFIRREILFEMRHGSGLGNNVPARTANARPVEPRIKNEEKFAAHAKNGLKLNLGCGHIPLEGFLNVDVRDLPGVDIVASIENLPVTPNTVDTLHSAHLIEHFPEELLTRRLLPYWKSLLRSGGTFTAIAPDTEAMVNALANGTYSFEDFREVLFGSQDYAGDYHYNAFTPASLTSLLRAAGFSQVEVMASARRNGKCFEFEISAAKED